MTEAHTPPDRDEFEITLSGPGFGESIVLHIGNGVWVIVDSCIDRTGEPRALLYLAELGVDPARCVRMVVATHWHDDHIRGMARLVAVCSEAAFCCASVLCEEEFLGVVGAVEGRRRMGTGSGIREIYEVFSRLVETAAKPVHAIAGRRIFSQGSCEIWALSPSDTVYRNFLRHIGALLPDAGRTQRRLPALSPNGTAVALWVVIEDTALLLGSDLEKPGWVEILRSAARPAGRALVFKVPHHGSAIADNPAVWLQMLETDVPAVLTPWRRGGHTLPGGNDVRRILSIRRKPIPPRKAVRFLRPPYAGTTRSPEPWVNPGSKFDRSRCRRVRSGFGDRAGYKSDGESRSSERHAI